jgi:hypothetical protein
MKVDPNNKPKSIIKTNDIQKQKIQSISVKNDVEQVKREIEKKTNKRIDDAYKNGTLVAPRDLLTATEEKKEDTENILKSIMGSGATEFNEKVGRQMTYGEMREMWG